MFNSRVVLNFAFAIIILLIAVYSLYTRAYGLSAVLSVSYLLHWRKGINVYFDHEHEEKSFLLYILYFVLFACIIIGSFYFSEPVVFFLSFGIAFLCALPALLKIRSKVGSDYKKRKIMLDLIASSGFFISGVAGLSNLMDIQVIVALNIIGHLLALIYIIRTKLYE